MLERGLVMQIIITAIVTFVITALWQSWGDRKNKKLLKLFVGSLRNELDTLSQRIGYEDIVEYWEVEKGKDYAQVAQKNFYGALESLE